MKLTKAQRDELRKNPMGGDAFDKEVCFGLLDDLDEQETVIKLLSEKFEQKVTEAAQTISEAQSGGVDGFTVEKTPIYLQQLFETLSHSDRFKFLGWLQFMVFIYATKWCSHDINCFRKSLRDRLEIAASASGGSSPEIEADLRRFATIVGTPAGVIDGTCEKTHTQSVDDSCA